VLSYLAARWQRANKPARHFEDWIIGRFGEVLYRIFFETYTEKVWGLPCTEIGSEWAAQRIKGLSLPTAIRNAFFGQRRGKNQIKTLIDAFDYPRTGAGLVYEKMSELIRRGGSTIMTDICATRFHRQGNRVVSVDSEGRSPSQGIDVEHLFSSIPLTEFILKLDPPPPDEVVRAARALYYRDHITVNLILNKPSVFPDNWIYVHSPEVRIARIADYGNFSADMLGDQGKTCVSVEYFAFADEDLWKMEDGDLIRFASDELDKLGLIRPDEIEDGFVVRERDSYPVYYVGHEPEFEKIRKYVDTLENVTLIGRGGMFKYNNQDHSILTGLLAARNYLGADHDLWDVNTEQEYLEERQVGQ
jgi:protoporphyrinogen oxidase